MTVFTPAALLVGLLVAPCAGLAQCLPLSQLMTLGTTPSPATFAAANGILSPTDWAFRGPISASSKEVYWSFLPPDTPAGAPAAVWLSLRPTLGQGCDAVLKTTRAECVRQLQDELKERKIKPEPVTCPQCVAQRYALPEAPGAAATIYSGMKGPFPFVVVVSGLPMASNSAAVRPAGSKSN